MYEFILSISFVDFCWDLGITSNTKMEVNDGKPEPVTGRPGKNSIVRHHSAEYFAGLCRTS